MRKPFNIILFIKGCIPYIIGIKHDNQWKMSSDVTYSQAMIDVYVYMQSFNM